MTNTAVTVLLAEDEPALPGLHALAGEARVREARTPAQLEALLPDTEVLVVTDFRTDLLGELWPDPCPIQWIHATSAGVDALMIEPIRNSSIPVTNASGIFDRGIAEYVLGAMLMFAKDSFTNLALQAKHQWQHRETRLLRGSRVLVVGAGSIGREVARVLRPLGLEVIGTARRARQDDVFHRVHRQEDLPALLGDADYVVITAPLTPATRNLFDDAQLRRLKPGAALINVGRGPVVETDALVRALQTGRLAGAALDVFDQEPLPPGHPLWDQPNVMISAHMAGDFIGWRGALGEQFVNNFRRWRRGQPMNNLVNKEHGYVTHAG